MDRIKLLAKYLEALYWETGIIPNSEQEVYALQSDLYDARKLVKSVEMCSDGFTFIPSKRLK